MAPFPKVSKGKLGYSIAEVDRLIAKARDQYSNLSANTLDWRELNTEGFSLEKNGYQPEAVDLALDKLQDTFAERALASVSNLPQELRELLLGRIGRPKGKRFRRAGVMGVGYSRKQVDAVLSLVSAHLEGGEKLEIGDVRTLTFKTQRGGYIESQVDSFFDRLVEYIQTERFGRTVTAPVASANYDFSGFIEPTDPGFQAY